MSVIHDVIKAVEDTPAEFLTSTIPLTHDGCLCAIGAYQYSRDADFRKLADKLRKKPVAYTNVHLRNMSNSAYDSIADLELKREIYAQNDLAMMMHAYDSAEIRKEAVLDALREIA